MCYMSNMNSKSDSKLVEALEQVDRFGDVAPAYVQDPMTMVLRQNAVMADLMRWDDSRSRYVLTGAGRQKITARHRKPGQVINFRTREDKPLQPPLRKA